LDKTTVLDSIADWLGVVLVHHDKPVVACILLLHRIYGAQSWYNGLNRL